MGYFSFLKMFNSWKKSPIFSAFPFILSCTEEHLAPQGIPVKAKDTQEPSRQGNSKKSKCEYKFKEVTRIHSYHILWTSWRLET